MNPQPAPDVPGLSFAKGHGYQPGTLSLLTERGFSIY